MYCGAPEDDFYFVVDSASEYPSSPIFEGTYHECSDFIEENNSDPSSKSWVIEHYADYPDVLLDGSIVGEY